MTVYSVNGDPSDLRRMNIIGRIAAHSEFENNIGIRNVSRITSLTDDQLNTLNKYWY